MTDKEKIVHDLALIHAQEKYREFLQNTPPKDRQFPAGVHQVAMFYKQGVLCIAPKIDEIMKAYLDDDKNPFIHD